MREDASLFKRIHTQVKELMGGTVEIITNGTIKVILKGRNEKILPVSDSVMIVIRRYLKIREGAEPSAPLFLSKRVRRIDTASVQHLVKKYCREACIEMDGLSPHMLRHSFPVATHPTQPFLPQHLRFLLAAVMRVAAREVSTRFVFLLIYFATPKLFIGSGFYFDFSNISAVECPL